MAKVFNDQSYRGYTGVKLELVMELRTKLFCYPKITL